MRSPSSLSVLLLAGAALASVVVVACTSDDGRPAVPVRANDDTSPSSIAGRECPDRSPLTYQSFGAPFFASYCTGCHSAKLAPELRAGAPPGIDFDTLDGIRARADRIYARAADDHTTMPPAGGPSAEQRRMLGDWLACGTPGEAYSADASALPPKPPVPEECGPRPNPLPPQFLNRCSTTTKECLASCTITDAACPGACINADTTPPNVELGYPFDCANCINYQQYECTDKNGCHEVVAELECCRRDKCATSSDPNCLVEKCRAEAYAYQYCLYSVTPTCASLVEGPAGLCFEGAGQPDGGPDGGGS